MEAYWGSGGSAPRIPNLGTSGRQVASPTHRERAPSIHWTGVWVGPRGGGEENSQPPPALEPPIVRPKKLKRK